MLLLHTTLLILNLCSILGTHSMYVTYTVIFWRFFGKCKHHLPRFWVRGRFWLIFSSEMKFLAENLEIIPRRFAEFYPDFLLHYVLQATCKKFWRARWMSWWKECQNLDHQITFRKVSSEVADVAEGNADDFFHERFALSNWVDVNWKFAFAPEVQVGQRLGLPDRLRSLGHL